MVGLFGEEIPAIVLVLGGNQISDNKSSRFSPLVDFPSLSDAQSVISDILQKVILDSAGKICDSLPEGPDGILLAGMQIIELIDVDALPEW